MLNRRRFLTIAAAASVAPLGARAADIHVETGIALGAKVTLRLAHPEARVFAARAMAEIRRLEAIFSLYQPGSALVRLNREGRLDAPPAELLECLSLADAVHRGSGGAFDPTVQPLWQAYAEAAQNGTKLTPATRAAALERTGWGGVQRSAGAIALRPGMALTLNGIAQGLIADRVANLLRAEGLESVLIDTGEMAALDGPPQGGAWHVALQQGGAVELANRALATSAPLGMTFAGDGRTSHILDPRSGRPAAAAWRGITISAPRAALADALSTAGCLLSTRDEIARMCDGFAGVVLESAVSA
ncbi:MAG: FAD:protein FMN transferase [Rhodobacteraceae bacterium]|nr:FAD:protein FMN transferase [Paracoccaceae bacterium]